MNKAASPVIRKQDFMALVSGMSAYPKLAFYLFIRLINFQLNGILSLFHKNQLIGFTIFHHSNLNKIIFFCHSIEIRRVSVNCN